MLIYKPYISCIICTHTMFMKYIYMFMFIEYILHVYLYAMYICI